MDDQTRAPSAQPVLNYNDPARDDRPLGLGDATDLAMSNYERAALAMSIYERAAADYFAVLVRRAEAEHKPPETAKIQQRLIGLARLSHAAAAIFNDPEGHAAELEAVPDAD